MPLINETESGAKNHAAALTDFTRSLHREKSCLLFSQLCRRCGLLPDRDAVKQHFHRLQSLLDILRCFTAPTHSVPICTVEWEVLLKHQDIQKGEKSNN